MTDYNIGDKVKLIGTSWNLTKGSHGYGVGDIVTVTGVSATGNGLIFNNGTQAWVASGSWSVEKVESNMQYELLYTKLAGDLTMTDLGEDRMLKWKPLRGTDKEVVNPFRVSHNIKGRTVTVAREYEYRYGSQKQYSYMKLESKRMQWNTEVEVHSVRTD